MSMHWPACRRIWYISTMSTKAEQITIRITSEQRERWEQHASADHRSLADWVRLQVEKVCDQLEKNAR